MLRQKAQARSEPQRVFPVVRVADVQRGKRRRREYPARRQNPLAIRPARRLPQVRRAHSEYERRQNQPERAQIYRQTHAYAAQQKRAYRVPAKSAVGEVERHHYHHRKGYVFAIKERVRVQARMQQKYQHSE